MNKKIYLIMPLSVLMLSGCSWRGKQKQAPVNPDNTLHHQDGNGSEEHSSIFDEHEQAFLLQEERNPFAPDGGVRLSDSEPLWVADQQVIFETIYFGFDQYRIAPEQIPALDRVADSLRQAVTDGSFVVIEGHACDSAGSPRYNTMLSEQRAQEVRKYLVKKGIPAEQLRVVGRGSEMRKVLTGNREQQAPNRRVEFYIVQEAVRAE